ncbi:MAG: DMT family transporter [Phyllobacteriaceae bacterium]|nr:DMT family transporter [Phyllobacteriaceae bacterium]
MRPADSPMFLLLAVGGLIGLVFPLGLMAATAGVDPAVWALTISGGTAVVLAVALTLRRRRVTMTRQFLRYCAVAGLVSFAAPNLLIFQFIPALGAGFVALLFTLSPVLTLLFSALMRVCAPSALGVAGIAIGFAGAFVLTWSKGASGPAGGYVVVLASLAIPLLLAIGNVYRTMDWPEGANPIALAVGAHAAASAGLLAWLAATGGIGRIAGLAGIPGLVLAQLAASSLQFLLFFRLQQVGGPVYLSQIGYVAASVGLGSGMIFLGERYGMATWSGAAVVAVGVAMTTLAQIRAAGVAAK